VPLHLPSPSTRFRGSNCKGNTPHIASWFRHLRQLARNSSLVILTSHDTSQVPLVSLQCCSLTSDSFHIPAHPRNLPGLAPAFRDSPLPSKTRPYVPEPSSTYRNLSPRMDTPLHAFPGASASDRVPTNSPAVDVHPRSRHLLRPLSEHLC